MSNFDRIHIDVNGETLTYPAAPASTAADPADRIAENLQFSALPTLENIRQFMPMRWPTDWRGWLHHVLKPVADHYGVDDSQLLQAWTKHYGPGVFLEKVAGPAIDAGEVDDVEQLVADVLEGRIDLAGVTIDDAGGATFLIRPSEVPEIKDQGDIDGRFNAGEIKGL